MLIIDRIEGEWAVVERDGLDFIDIRLSDLPDFVKVGDVLVLGEDGAYYPDDKATAERRSKILDKQKNLFKRKSEK